MADSVQFILDRLSPTLTRLEELKLFSSAEIRSIVKKRTDYEYVMKRRLLTPADFYSYLQYELNLDKLFVIRCDFSNAGKEKTDSFRSVEGACRRHISYIFDRAIRRFPSDMGLWADYVSFLKEKRLTSALNAVFGRVLGLHPKNENLWLQAAIHELDVNNNLHSARTLLQRSLRANKTSHKLWKKYFELELWNAVRITERQRVLGLDVDNSPIHGAPLVIFKHALISMPTDIDFGCELHKVSLSVSTSLGESLEKMLLANFGKSCQFWSYLASLSFDRHAIQFDASDNRYVQGRLDNDIHHDVEKKKRKRTKATAEDIVEYVAKSLDTFVAVAESARAVFEEDLNGGAQEGEGEASKYPVMMIAAIEEILLKASTFIGRITQVSFSHYQSTLTEGGAESSQTQSLLKEALSRSLSHLWRSLEALSVIMQHTAQCYNLQTSSKSNASPSPVSVFTAVEALAEYRIWRLRSIIAPKSSSHPDDGAMDINKLTAWCARETVSVQSMMAGRRTSVRTTEKELKEIFTAWGRAVRTVMEAAVRSWALECLSASDADVISNSTASNSLRVVGAMVMQASSVLCSTSEGNDLLHRCVEVMASAGYCDIVSKGLRDIVSSPYCDPGTRGLWCAQLVKFCVTIDVQCDLNAVKVNTKKRARDDDEDDVVSTVTPTPGVKSSSEDVFNYLESMYHRQPELLVGSGIHIMYETVLAIEMKALAALSINKRDYTYVRTVAARAVEVCPSEASFWATLEQVLRAQGKHQEANHVKWRRDRECSR